MTADTTPAQWTYTGRRTTAADKTVQAFVDEAGAERWYGALVPSWAKPGSVFEVHVTADGKSVMTKGPNAPRYLRATDRPLGDVAEWEAADALAERRQAATRK